MGSAKKPGRLRIVAGNWRSRLLPVADVEGLRPTSERIRETLFNWLGPRIHGMACLDLFAGTGALGFEALSRGAAQVVFVERSAAALRALRESAAALKAEAAEIIHGDASTVLAQFPAASFDLVFLDPPFADESIDELCRLIAERELLRPRGLVYVEQDRASPQMTLPEGWEIHKSRTAGNVRFSLLVS